MDAKADGAERAKAFQRAIQWFTAPEAEGIRSAAFTHWLAESHYHMEEAIQAACIWHQIRALSPAECAKIDGPSHNRSRKSKETAQVLTLQPPRYGAAWPPPRRGRQRRIAACFPFVVVTSFSSIRALSGWYQAAARIVRIAAAADSAPDTSSARTIEPRELQRGMAWRYGRIEFYGEPLRDVLQEFERYHSVKFVITDPTIAKLALFGTVTTASLDDFLVTLNLEFGLRATVTLTPSGVSIITLSRPQGARQ